MLDSLEGFAVTYSISVPDGTSGVWQARIEDAVTGIDELSTLLNVLHFTGNKAAPHRFFFEKGAPWVNLYVTEKLSRICGALLLIPNDIMVPVVLQPGVDPDRAVERWISMETHEPLVPLATVQQVHVADPRRNRRSSRSVAF